MKMYKKAECEYRNGYIVKGDEIICIDNEIVDLLNQLEYDYQKAMFEKANTIPPMPEAPEFGFVTERGKVFPHVHASTPKLDEVVETTMKIMDELDASNMADACNEYFEGIEPVLLFVNDGYVVDCEQAVQHRFDLKNIGNPLELDKDKLADFVIKMFE